MADKETMIGMRDRHAKFAGPLDELCEFYIGQQVAFRDVLDCMQVELEMNGPTVVEKDPKRSRYGTERAAAVPPMTIVSRWVEQCYGGIQVHYSLRAVVGLVGKSVTSDIRMFESELMDWQEAMELRKQFVVEYERD